MTTGSVIDTVTGLLVPIVSDLGLELYDVEFAGGVLKVSIDTPPGQEAGVTLDQITLVTRLLGRDLDHSDVVPGKYTLEVTSPGLERTLRTPEHFQREIGKVVNIRLTEQLDGRRRVQGKLTASTQDSCTVADAESRTDVVVPFHLIDKARTVFVWAPTPKPNSPEARAARKSGPSSHSASLHTTEVSA